MVNEAPVHIGEFRVGPIGFGAWNLSRAPLPDRGRAIRTIHTALDHGVRLIDTADAYCPVDEMGHNERLVAEALRTWTGERDQVLVATKGGHLRTPDGAWAVDGRPEHLFRACDASLRALGTDCIGLYQHHRPDPGVPYAETLGALEELRRQGKVRYVGISNATIAQIADAATHVPVAAVQNELSPWFRSSLGEARTCAAWGVPFLAWGTLGGRERAHQLPGDRTLAARARSLGVSPQQLVLAWVRAQAPTVVPVVGASRPETLLASLAAADLVVDPVTLAAL